MTAFLATPPGLLLLAKSLNGHTWRHSLFGMTRIDLIPVFCDPGAASQVLTLIQSSGGGSHQDSHCGMLGWYQSEAMLPSQGCQCVTGQPCIPVNKGNIHLPPPPTHKHRMFTHTGLRVGIRGQSNPMRTPGILMQQRTPVYKRLEPKRSVACGNKHWRVVDLKPGQAEEDGV